MTTERQVARDVGRAPVADGSSAIVDLSSNDYLGLRNDPRVRAAAIRGIERYGVGSGGARENERERERTNRHGLSWCWWEVLPALRAGMP